MNDLQRQFLDRAKAEAIKANHPFPCMVACEAALESNWGNSQLAREANNLFGMKQHTHPVCGTMTLPTKEFLDGKWTACSAEWVKYPDWRGCFADRFATLERLSNAYPHYKAALDAKDPRTYIIEVSKSWSTDPGWPCSCGEAFLSLDAAQIHAHGSGSTHGAGHVVGSVVPGLGRAVKVLHIYQDYKHLIAALDAAANRSLEAAKV